jgi:hypothetical protein
MITSTSVKTVADVRENGGMTESYPPAGRWYLGAGAVVLSVILLLRALLVAFALGQSPLGRWWVQALIVGCALGAYAVGRQVLIHLAAGRG